MRRREKGGDRDESSPREEDSRRDRRRSRDRKREAKQAADEESIDGVVHHWSPPRLGRQKSSRSRSQDAGSSNAETVRDESRSRRRRRREASSDANVEEKGAVDSGSRRRRRGDGASSESSSRSHSRRERPPPLPEVPKRHRATGYERHRPTGYECPHGYSPPGKRASRHIRFDDRAVDIPPSGSSSEGEQDPPDPRITQQDLLTREESSSADDHVGATLLGEECEQERIISASKRNMDFLNKDQLGTSQLSTIAPTSEASSFPGGIASSESIGVPDEPAPTVVLCNRCGLDTTSTEGDANSAEQKGATRHQKVLLSGLAFHARCFCCSTCEAPFAEGQEVFVSKDDEDSDALCFSCMLAAVSVAGLDLCTQFEVVEPVKEEANYSSSDLRLRFVPARNACAVMGRLFTGLCSDERTAVRPAVDKSCSPLFSFVDKACSPLGAAPVSSEKSSEVKRQATGQRTDVASFGTVVATTAIPPALEWRPTPVPFRGMNTSALLATPDPVRAHSSSSRTPSLFLATPLAGRGEKGVTFADTVVRLARESEEQPVRREINLCFHDSLFLV